MTRYNKGDILCQGPKDRYIRSAEQMLQSEMKFGFNNMYKMLFTDISDPV